MPFSDQPLAELVNYFSDVNNPSDFESFWDSTLGEARSTAGPITLARADSPITELIVEELTFPGFGGELIRAWITRPNRAGRLTTVLQYQGYGGGQGMAHENLHWAAAGFCHIVMDTRGQASQWGTGGVTSDPHGSGPSSPGVMTRGIGSRDSYYYRRVYTDAVRMFDAARTLDFVDPSRVAATGISQGGGVSLAVAGLVPDLFAVMPDVPFLNDFPRSVRLTPSAPFSEIAQYLSVHRDQVDDVFSVLAYFDGVNFARRATAPARFSVALMDDVVLPSTVFAAYNAYSGTERVIDVYEFNGHEGGLGHQWLRQVEWLRDRIS